jgi:hypothetical protein
VLDGCITAGSAHKLLRFDFLCHNAGNVNPLLFYPERDAEPAVSRELKGREGALRRGNNAADGLGGGQRAGAGPGGA